MNELAKIDVARPVHRHGASFTAPAAARGAIRRAVKSGDAPWIEIADHILFGGLPIAGVAASVVEGVKAGRVPLRAILLTALFVL